MGFLGALLRLCDSLLRSSFLGLGSGLKTFKLKCTPLSWPGHKDSEGESVYIDSRGRACKPKAESKSRNRAAKDTNIFVTLRNISRALHLLERALLALHATFTTIRVLLLPRLESSSIQGFRLSRMVLLCALSKHNACTKLEVNTNSPPPCRGCSSL